MVPNTLLGDFQPLNPCKNGCQACSSHINFKCGTCTRMDHPRTHRHTHTNKTQDTKQNQNQKSNTMSANAIPANTMPATPIDDAANESERTSNSELGKRPLVDGTKAVEKRVKFTSAKKLMIETIRSYLTALKRRHVDYLEETVKLVIDEHDFQQNPNDGALLRQLENRCKSGFTAPEILLNLADHINLQQRLQVVLDKWEGGVPMSRQTTPLMDPVDDVEMPPLSLPAAVTQESQIPESQIPESQSEPSQSEPESQPIDLTVNVATEVEAKTEPFNFGGHDFEDKGYLWIFRFGRRENLTKVLQYKIPGWKKDIVYIIDASGSMHGKSHITSRLLRFQQLALQKVLDEKQCASLNLELESKAPLLVPRDAGTCFKHAMYALLPCVLHAGKIVVITDGEDRDKEDVPECPHTEIDKICEHMCNTFNFVNFVWVCLGEDSKNVYDVVSKQKNTIACCLLKPEENIEPWLCDHLVTVDGSSDNIVCYDSETKVRYENKKKEYVLNEDDSNFIDKKLKIEHSKMLEFVQLCTATDNDLILRNFYEALKTNTGVQKVVKLYQLDMIKFARVVLGCILEASLAAIQNTQRNIVIPAEWWGKFGEFTKAFIESYGGKEFRAVLNSTICSMASGKMGMVSAVIAEAIPVTKKVEKEFRKLLKNRPAYRVEERCEAKIKSLLKDLDADVPKQRNAKAKHVKGL